MSEGQDSPPGAGAGPRVRQLPRPVEEIRAELMADPDVREQAKMLKVPVAQYVEKIIDYAIHPDKPAQLQIVPDEELKARDPNVPTVEELKTHLEKIASGEIVFSPAHQPDGFKDDRVRERYSVELGTSETEKGAPEIKSNGTAGSEEPKAKA
jgi:hypothetical protein